MDASPTSRYHGKHFTLDGAQCDPKPVQQPHPEILIGGGGEQLTLRVVARHADTSNFGGKPHEWQHKAEVLQQHCKDVGRDYDEIRKTISPEVFIRETEQEVLDAGSRSFWGEPAESWRAGNLVGTPEQVAEKMQDLRRPRVHRLLPVVQRLPRHRDVPAVRASGSRPALTAVRRRSCVKTPSVE